MEYGKCWNMHYAIGHLIVITLSKMWQDAIPKLTHDPNLYLYFVNVNVPCTCSSGDADDEADETSLPTMHAPPGRHRTCPTCPCFWFCID